MIVWAQKKDMMCSGLWGLGGVSDGCDESDHRGPSKPLEGPLHVHACLLQSPPYVLRTSLHMSIHVIFAVHTMQSLHGD